MIYSKIFLAGILCLKYIIGSSQNIGIGVSNPAEKLEVNGGIKIGITNNIAPGTIRWNDIKSDFEGYNGKAWVSLTGGKSSWGNQATFSTENSASDLQLYYNNFFHGKYLGYSMAAKGNWLVAGAYMDVDPNSTTQEVGSLRIFRRSGDDWSSLYDVINPTLEADRFGLSVDMTSTHIIAGAYHGKVGNNSEQGKAYVYVYSNQNIALQTSLTATDGMAFDHFGQAVAADSIYAAVGAPWKNVNGQNKMGGVYVYQRNGTFWSQHPVITPGDGQALDGFGASIALKGIYLAIASPYKTINGEENAGKVYVYRYSGVSLGWVLIAQLTAPDLTREEQFGSSLYIGDNMLFVGGPGPIGVGKVHIFNINAFTLSYQTLLTPSDGRSGEQFGCSIAYLDSTVLVGSRYARVGAGTGQGKAYVFKKTNGQWVEQAILTGSTNESQMHFGSSVALTPEFGIASAPSADLNNVWNENGRIFFFKR